MCAWTFERLAKMQLAKLTSYSQIGKPERAKAQSLKHSSAQIAAAVQLTLREGVAERADLSTIMCT
jgi:hypothetical protein